MGDKERRREGEQERRREGEGEKERRKRRREGAKERRRGGEKEKEERVEEQEGGERTKWRSTRRKKRRGRGQRSRGGLQDWRGQPKPDPDAAEAGTAPLTGAPRGSAGRLGRAGCCNSRTPSGGSNSDNT